MARIRCWRCGDEQAPAFFCGACGTVQGLSHDADYFAVLGLPPDPAVDEEALAARYYDLSRRLHPDRHQTADAREQVESVRATAVLNAAYQTLRDLESRGRYWLRRSGEELGRDNNRVPPELAELVFEAQEKLAEATSASPAQRAAQRPELEALQRSVAAERTRERAALTDVLASWPPGGNGAANGHDDRAIAARARLKDLLSRLAYLRTLERDVASALEE
ncbi:MAG TPA: DnaJ domain-containing protein [Candidatus Binatia bacterium]|nr:DnaJ domain-containing protein [Candidatus Binatia bacterium]